MQLAPLDPASALVRTFGASPFDRVPVAVLDYVLRAPKGEVMPARIEARVAPDSSERLAPAATYADAVRRAQARASAERIDPFHRQAINPAMAVLQATDGAFYVAELQGDHRDAVGPLFIDGSFFRRGGLGVYGSRTDARLQAIVGTEQLIDLRQAPMSGLESIEASLRRA